MPKFRKKPVVIEAQQWDGTEAGSKPLIEWMGGAGRYEPGEAVNAKVHPAHLVITTLEDGPNGEAKHVASPDDWVIKGVAGEFYACKPDIFSATYEPADVPPDSAWQPPGT